MNQDQFVYLLDDVEEAGGRHLPEVCSGAIVPYEQISKENGVPRVKNAQTHACHHSMRLSIPYEGIEQKEGLPAAHQGEITVCAEGDWVHLWPRFRSEAM